ncbi:pantetheine-phosphate adenylyltransferase [Borrelia anserina]|uniref:Phosphopantetheine adenylyltransferase n=2 Tax=Borrelia anserina TaxID=143 RepID=W5SN95_BORAN|nr:pantetheine-phosphate adenylyltransferase [Borrelia anserina]AHH08669.1 Phosphopantetheine adenylyltransferase [Borrelia anserina BA2]APR65126.1 pantetheine-phosphate adenylyltransferase [Borrelia anserina Es]UPA07052.1 pantetheine-phosphate adenylyltransferase [Borrelia anserina]
MRVALFPGSFDPITWGHIDLVKRASMVFDKIIVLVANNSAKNYLLSDIERYELASEVISSLKLPRVIVDRYDGIILDYALKNSIGFIVRGVRAFHDFEFEFERYVVNNKLSPLVDTIFLPSSNKYLFVRSDLVKELMKNKNFDLSSFIPELVQKKLKSKFVDKLS